MLEFRQVIVASQPDGDRSILMSSPDRESRLNAAKNAIAITRLEGGEPSPFVQLQLNRFAAGLISAAELREAVAPKDSCAGVGYRSGAAEKDIGRQKIVYSDGLGVGFRIEVEKSLIQRASGVGHSASVRDRAPGRKDSKSRARLYGCSERDGGGFARVQNRSRSPRVRDPVVTHPRNRGPETARFQGLGRTSFLSDIR